MTIDPRFAFWFGVWTSVLLLVASGTVNLTGALPDLWVPVITKWCAILGAINSTILTAASGYSSNKLGPMVNAPANPAMTVVKVLLIAFALSFLVAGGSAQAVTLTGNAQADLAAARAAKAKPAPQSPTDVLTKIMNDISKVKAEVIAGTVADITAADADAATLLNSTDPASFKDPIAHACYPAEIKFLQSLPSAAAPTGSYILVQLFQRKRDFVAQLQAGIPAYLKLGCSALLGDEIQILTKSLALVGVTLGANALLPGSGIFAMPPLF